MSATDRSSRLPLLVIGGGIGGLAAALAIASAGRRVVVFEKAARFGEIGAGLQLAPNATHVLHRLRVLDDVLEHAVRPGCLVMRDAVSNAVLTSVDLGRPFLDHFGFPYIVMHRGDLLAAELRACRTNPLITLEAGKDVVSIDGAGSDVVSIECADGTAYDAEAVVGADGLWSRTREALGIQGAAVCAPFVAYRGTVPFDTLPEGVDTNSMTIWVGPDLHFVQYVVRSGELLNQVAVFKSPRYQPGAETREDWGTPDELDEQFSRASPTVRAGLARIDRTRRWAMFDRPPLTSWSRGGTTLLGDAAHPMLQYAAQGACQALEDALCLGESFAEEAEPAEAFRRYECRRLARTARVQHTARLVGEIFHCDGAAAEERNALLARRAPDDFEYFEWLYGYRGEGS